MQQGWRQAAQPGCRRRGAIARRPGLTGVVVALCLSIAPGGVRAQPVRSRVLSGIEVRNRPEDVEIRVNLSVPVRVIRYAPRERGDLIHVEVELLRESGIGREDVSGREALHGPEGIPVPLEEVLWEPNDAAGPALELRFSREVRIRSVRSGSDLRSVRVLVAPDARAARAAARAARAARAAKPPLPRGTGHGVAGLPPPDEEAMRWMTAAREAMIRGELDRAVALFTKILTLPESQLTPEALELLALARERRGQLAHAKAEYEDYLKRYPEGEGAERVRQRLDALLSARAKPPAQRRIQRARRTDYDFFGSLSTTARHDSTLVAEEGAESDTSSLLSDVFLGGRARTERFTLRSQASASYRYALQGGSDPESRVSALFVEALDREGPLEGSFGRQPGNQAGVIGRFDGGRVGVHLGEQWRVSGLAGFPVEPTTSDRIETGRRFGALSVDAKSLFGGLDVELFAIHQTVDGLVDRTAVGSEFRYFDDGSYLAGFTDFDLHFGELDTALLLGSWQASAATQVSFLLDYRYSPSLSTSNALIGQTVERVSDLEGLFGTQEIEQLALDRTARSRLANVGVTHRLTERLQVAVDLTASDLSATETSGGIEGTPATGPDLDGLVQLIGTDLVRRGDVAILGLRVLDGTSADLLSVLANVRFPVGRARLNPRLDVSLRSTPQTDRVLIVRPSLRVDARLWRLLLDAEAGLEWAEAPIDTSTDTLGYTLSLGLRYDF